MMDELIKHTVEVTGSTYEPIPMVGVLIVILLVAAGCAFKFFIDDRDWGSPLVLAPLVLAMVVGVYVFAGIPAARSRCKELYNQGLTEPGLLGSTPREQILGAFEQDHCYLIVQCPNSGSRCE